MRMNTAAQRRLPEGTVTAKGRMKESRVVACFTGAGKEDSV